MARITNFPSSAAQPADFVIGSSPTGRSKKMSVGSIASLVRNSINTLNNFSVSNSDNGYTLDWNNNTLTVDGPSIEDAILSVNGAGPVSVVTSERNSFISLKYSGTRNIIDAAGIYKAKTSNINFFVENKAKNEVKKIGIDKLPFTNNTGTVTAVTIADENGTGKTITESGTINIKGGNGITTSMVGADLTIEYLGKVGGTVNNVISLDETVLLTSISQDGSEVSIRPARVPVRIGRYDFASVTVDKYGRVTQIEDQKHIMDALVARIEALESQIQSQDESSTDTSN
jgi:uncharacterized protein YdeI (BOF family)